MTHAHNRYRIDPEVHARALHEAKLEGISVRSFIRNAIEDECARRLRARRSAEASERAERFVHGPPYWGVDIALAEFDACNNPAGGA